MKITLFALALFLSFSLFGQGRKRDVVYLKNGSILRGTIVVQDPGKLIQLRTTDYSLWVFQQDQIDSIKRLPSPRIASKTGYFNLTELGFFKGNIANTNKALSLLNISQWKFKNGLAPGIGVGIEFSNETYLPVVADIRYYFRDRQPMPFFSFQTGYSIPIRSSFSPSAYYGYWSSSVNYSATKAKGGFLFNPSVGIQIPANDNLALLFSAGYYWMKYNYEGDKDYRLDIEVSRLSLKIGLLFK